MVSEAMLPRAAVKEVEARLTAAGCPDADFDARELFRLATGRDVRLSDRPLDAAEAAKLEELTVRRAAREPLQYLCGSWPFLDFELAVGPGVLCPRADTEVVAETAAEMLAGGSAPGAGPLRRYRLSGPWRQAALPGGAGRLRGKEPGGLRLSREKYPSGPERPGRQHRKRAGCLAF